MAKFIEGDNRFQITIFPERMDDFVSEDNPVRVVDVFIDGLDLSGLGFKSEPKLTGRPGPASPCMLTLPATPRREKSWNVRAALRSVAIPADLQFQKSDFHWLAMGRLSIRTGRPPDTPYDDGTTGTPSPMSCPGGPTSPLDTSLFCNGRQNKVNADPRPEVGDSCRCPCVSMNDNILDNA